MGPARYLIINAAMLPPLTPGPQIEPKSFNRALTLNVLATQALLAAFDPLLRRSEVGGRVIGLESISDWLNRLGISKRGWF